MKPIARGKQIGRALARLALAGAAVVATTQASPAWPADGEIVIRANAIEPHVFHATMGQRVNFVKRVDLPVHVEFGLDRSESTRLNSSHIQKSRMPSSA